VEGGSRSGSGRGTGTTRSLLVVGQVALATTLLVVAALLTRSFNQLVAVPPGFQPEGVLTFDLSAPRDREGREGIKGYYRDVWNELEALPGITGVGMVSDLPFTTENRWTELAFHDRVVDPTDPIVAEYHTATPEYFDVMGIPLLRGRTFQPSDRDDAPLVVVIDETMAERFWPGEDPVGHRLTMQETRSAEDREIQWRTVVGVVPNLRHYELTSPSRVQAYVPMRQALRAAGTGMYIVAKARGDASAVPGLVRATVSRLRPDIPVFEPRMLSDYVADETGQSRALGVTTTLFGVVAALLAALGIFGVLSLSVARRAPELGLRLAVGATPRNVVTMVVGQGMALVAVGTAVGVTASVFTGRALGAVLFEVRPWDGGVYATVVVVLLAVASLAALRPALRAARTQPVEVLKGE